MSLSDPIDLWKVQLKNDSIFDWFMKSAIKKRFNLLIFYGLVHEKYELQKVSLFLMWYEKLKRYAFSIFYAYSGLQEIE